jgi:hypothetical protein
MFIGLVSRFIDHLQVMTTNNCNTIADFHTTNHSTLSLLNLLSLVFTWSQLSTMAVPLQCFLVLNLSNGDFSASIACWLTLTAEPSTALHSLAEQNTVG